MRLIDEQNIRMPFYGSRRLRALRVRSHTINRERVQRLMRHMGLESIYPKPNVTRPHLDLEIFPYLLKNLDINLCDLVWGTDITYIRLNRGWL